MEMIEIGSFFLKYKETTHGMIYEIEPINKRLFGTYQFVTEEAAILFAKKLSKRHKRFEQKIAFE